MSIPIKQQFLTFAENLYLAKIQGQPISDEINDWAVGIMDSPTNGEYLLSVMSPSGHEERDITATVDTLLSTFGYLYDQLASLDLNDKEILRYEDLSNGIKANLALGHVLAKHTSAGPFGLVGMHLTTVQLGVAHDEQGRSVDYCNDVCGDLCEPGSVKILMVEMPKEKPFFLTEPVLLEGTIGGEPTSVWFAFPKEGEGEFVLTSEGSAFTAASAQAAFAAQARLEEFRAWTYERYRAAVLAEDARNVQSCTVTLFFLITGMKPKEDYELLGRFAEFLVDSVIVDDAEVMPVFPVEAPEAGAGG